MFSNSRLQQLYKYLSSESGENLQPAGALLLLLLLLLVYLISRAGRYSRERGRVLADADLIRVITAALKHQ